MSQGCSYNSALESNQRARPLLDETTCQLQNWKLFQWLSKIPFPIHSYRSYLLPEHSVSGDGSITKIIRITRCACWKTTPLRVTNEGTETTLTNLLTNNCRSLGTIGQHWVIQAKRCSRLVASSKLFHISISIRSEITENLWKHGFSPVSAGGLGGGGWELGWWGLPFLYSKVSTSFHALALLLVLQGFFFFSFLIRNPQFWKEFFCVCFVF